MNRRTFLEHTAATVTLVALGACGSKDSGGTTETPQGTGSGTGTGAGTGTGTGTGGGTGTGSGTGTGTGGGTGTGTGGTNACNSADGTANDGEGHGHTLTIPMADWQAGAGGTYRAVGGLHAHDVTLTAQDMADLAANCTVTVTSDDTHYHSWIISIA